MLSNMAVCSDSLRSFFMLGAGGKLVKQPFRSRRLDKIVSLLNWFAILSGDGHGVSSG